MVVSTIAPQLLVESLSREKMVLMPFAEYETLLTRLESDTLVDPRLTAQLEWADGQWCAFCPELDLATAGDAEDEAVLDLAELAVEYAEDYLDDFTFYANSPDRSGHLSRILAIARRTTDVRDSRAVRRVRELFVVQHGDLA